MAKYRNTVFSHYQSRFLVIFSSNYQHRLVLKIPFPKYRYHIFSQNLEIPYQNSLFHVYRKILRPPLQSFTNPSFNGCKNEASTSINYFSIDNIIPNEPFSLTIGPRTSDQHLTIQVVRCSAQVRRFAVARLNQDQFENYCFSSQRHHPQKSLQSNLKATYRKIWSDMCEQNAWQLKGKFASFLKFEFCFKKLVEIKIFMHKSIYTFFRFFNKPPSCYGSNVKNGLKFKQLAKQLPILKTLIEKNLVQL